MNDTQPMAPTDDEIHAVVQACRERGLREFDVFRAVLAKWGTPPAVAGEPIGYCHEIKWRAHQSEQVQKITRKAHPEYGYTQALYTTPQPTHAQPVAREPLSAEQYNILVEDLSEWSRHVEVDTAPRSLEEHIHQVFAIHGIKGGQHVS